MSYAVRYFFFVFSGHGGADNRQRNMVHVKGATTSTWKLTVQLPWRALYSPPSRHIS